MPKGLTGPKTANNRAEPRDHVLKGAKLVFGGVVIDCSVLDISAQGARVSVAASVLMPELVAFHLRGGTVYQARRCWSRGRELGFEFVGIPALNEIAVEAAWLVYEALRGVAPSKVLATLNELRHFDDPALQALAQQLGNAYEALVTALQQRAARR